MIIGTKETLATYKGISEGIDKAIDYILSLDPAIEPGKHEIDGDKLFVNVVCGETKPLDGFEYEAHKKYLDLQYIIEGSEVMIYAPLDGLKRETEYDEDKDCHMFSGEGTPITVKAGDFYLVHPFDAHAPGRGYETNSFKKAIVKIKL